MCGRFVSARKRLELLEEFGVTRDRVTDEPAPDYNVAPTKQIYAVLTNKERERELRTVKWGLVPFWAKDSSGGGRLINARAETVAVKPAFRRAFAKRRCLLPADGYYEWKDKKPFYIHRTDGGDLALAGIYELWRDNTVPEDHDQAWLWTAAVITTQAADEVGEIHDRMPMIIVPELWADWLDPENTEVSQLQAAMSPAMSGEITSYSVSTDVNYVRNNGPELIRPLPTGG
ncbi:MAG: SOS response-associated peptidase [Streptosporangiaceae bacterium]|nr:SOS response-associated peptidase [Streptosporangiaceae bacterium]